MDCAYCGDAQLDLGVDLVCSNPDCGGLVLESGAKIRETEDPVVNRVLQKHIDRSNQGMERFGKTIADNPKVLRQWLMEIQEEIFDAAVYIERALMELE